MSHRCKCDQLCISYQTMFVYSYFFRSNKRFRIFRNVIQVLLSYINICAGMTSSLHKFCQDHSRRKSNTSIKKRSPHQQHHTGSRNQHALQRCHARASIIFPALTCRGAPAYTYQPTIPIACGPGPLVSPGKTGEEFICRLRARAAA